MTHTEFCGVALIDICRVDGNMTNKVVRWCPNCGAVVVDEDYDTRIRPGAYREMQFPVMAQAELARRIYERVVDPQKLSQKDQEKLLAGINKNAERVKGEEGKEKV